MRFFSGSAVPKVDELSYLSIRAEDAVSLLEVISRRYRQDSVVPTTNRSVA